MNYRKIYTKIISKAKSENRQKGLGIYYENHHILPKSLFPLWGDRFNKRNTVLLTAREHYFCHQLLCKIFPGQKMFLALWYLTSSYYGVSSLKYQQLKIKFSENMKNNWKNSEFRKKNLQNRKIKPSKETIEKRRLKLLGQKRTEEQRKRMSESMKGKNSGKTFTRSDSFCKLTSERQKGKVHWWNNRVIQVFQEVCPAGFIAGQCNRKKPKSFSKEHIENMSNKKWYNNGSICKKSKECPEGFKLGRIGWKKLN